MRRCVYVRTYTRVAARGALANLPRLTVQGSDGIFSAIRNFVNETRWGSVETDGPPAAGPYLFSDRLVRRTSVFYMGVMNERISSGYEEVT